MRFYSKKLFPAEQNYDIRNREKLAIELALEEWRHWLEGANHQFEVITEHRNLEYLREAKRLNPRQARWAPFFTWFDFIVSYRPETVFVSPIVWDIEQISQENRLHPAPSGGPEGLVFVPPHLCATLLDSAHTASGSGDPGSRRTLSLLSYRYWCPPISQDVSWYIRGCSVCAVTNTPRRLSEVKLVPLPIPQRPWSHIGIDFMTDLPRSNNHTCIFVVVDHLSKVCKLIPLSGLPTAFEGTESPFNHVFRNFPEDIVSDRGPQFISRVWQAFFRLLRVTVSLSSGYHPQKNGKTERKIQEIGRYLRTYCHQFQDSWSRFLPWAEYAWNSLRQSTTRLTPFSVGWVVNLHSFLGLVSQLSTTGSIRARGYGTRLTCNSSWQCGVTRTKQIVAVRNLLSTGQDKSISLSFHVSILKPFTEPVTSPPTEPVPADVPPTPDPVKEESIYRVCTTWTHSDEVLV
ncbi:retrotransposable element [Pimephales promelas]|nr:retrotransposable element [Pimephales promelas]